MARSPGGSTARSPGSGSHVRRAREALGTGDPGAIRRAAEAAGWGPVPDDPIEREQGRRMALVLRDQVRRRRPLIVAAIALLVGLALVLAFLAGTVSLLLVLLPLPAAMAALAWWLPRRYDRRAELLRQPPYRTPDREAC